MITNFFMLLGLIVSFSFGCSYSTNQDLEVEWKIEDETLTLEYINLSDDTIYVADLSLSRSKGKVLPRSLCGGTVNMKFFLKSSDMLEEEGEGVKIFLGKTIIPPKQKYILLYRYNEIPPKKVVVEYSKVKPTKSPYSVFKRLVIFLVR